MLIISQIWLKNQSKQQEAQQNPSRIEKEKNKTKSNLDTSWAIVERQKEKPWEQETIHQIQRDHNKINSWFPIKKNKTTYGGHNTVEWHI